VKRKPTEADILMWDQLKEAQSGISTCLREHQFDVGRGWRFDFAISWNCAGKYEKAGIEIEGGAWTQGRHRRGAGFIEDMEKYNHAALLGWRVLRFTPSQVLDGTAIAFIRKVLES